MRQITPDDTDDSGEGGRRLRPPFPHPQSAPSTVYPFKNKIKKHDVILQTVELFYNYVIYYRCLLRNEKR